LVGYDSIIPPGRVGKITQEIKLKDAHPGKMSKHITVSSNAGNTPEVDLTTYINLVAYIATSTQFLDFFSTGSDSGRKEITLTTDMPNLSITSVLFKVSEDGNKPAWQKGQVITVPFVLKRAPKTNSDGRWDYTLSMAMLLKVPEGLRGNFYIKTNHPQKPELVMGGRLENSSGPDGGVKKP
jgi:hypothetical protein